MRRIWDAVLITQPGDLDLLEARFTEFADLPVVHVIAEAPVDHQGNPKPLHFADLEHVEGSLWQRWRGRWNHVRAEARELPQGDPKARKDALREYLAHGVAAEPDDIVLHGSVDEIPSARTLKALLAGEAHVPVGMEMRWCAYTPHLVHPRPWRGTVAQEWRLAGSFAGMREKRLTLPAIVDAGTRLSMLGEPAPEDGMHPDGHALRTAEIDGTWPEWVRARSGTQAA
jgi:hypothetical protein